MLGEQPVNQQRQARMYVGSCLLQLRDARSGRRCALKLSRPQRARSCQAGVFEHGRSVAAEGGSRFGVVDQTAELRTGFGCVPVSMSGRSDGTALDFGAARTIVDSTQDSSTRILLRSMTFCALTGLWHARC